MSIGSDIYTRGEVDLATILANDASLSTVLKDNIVFLDQYSEEIPVPVYKPVKLTEWNHTTL